MRTRNPITVLGADGRPLAGASVFTRNRHDGTDATVYAAETGAGAGANPAISDVRDRVLQWLERGDYASTVTAAGMAPYVEEWDSAPGKDGAVVVPWLDPAAIIPPDGSITTAKIADAAVTAAKMAAGVLAPKIQRQSSKPVAPAVGDLWEYPYVADVNWLFRWSGTVWECIGGVPFMSYQGINETRPDNGAYGDTATVGPSFTVPFAGHWSFWSHVGLATASNYGTQMWVGQSVAGGGGSDFDAAAVKVPDGGHGSHLSGPPFDQSWSVAAGAVVKTQYKCLQQGGGGYTASFYIRRLYAMPLYLT